MPKRYQIGAALHSALLSSIAALECARLRRTRWIPFVAASVLLLTLAPLAQAQGLIDEDPRWDYPHFLGFRPADGRAVEVNPPRFSWPYRPEVIGGQNEPLKRFRFQVDNDIGFGSPEVDVTVDYNFYNTLSPFSAGTWYWRVGYDHNANGSVDEWSAEKSFTVSGSEPQWDRSAHSAAAVALAAMPRPRMGPIGGDWQAFKAWLEDTNHPRRQDWLNQLTSKASQYVAMNWYVDAAYFPPTDVDESDGAYDAKVTFSIPGGTDSWNTNDFGRFAQYATLVAFAYKVTDDPAFAGAKDVILRFAQYPHTSTSLSWPEYNGGTTKQSVCIAEYLALAFDWYHTSLTTTERDLLIDRVATRVEQVYTAGKSWRSSTDAYQIGVGVTGRSHPYQNFFWAMPGLLLMTGEDSGMDSLDLVPMTLDFLTGVTASANYGSDDGAINEGVGYGGEKQGTMLRSALMAEMLLDLGQEKNPFPDGYQRWYSHVMPNGYGRIPFGDQWGYNLIEQQLHNQRAITLLTANPRARARWDALAAEEGDLLETYTFSRPWTILLAEQRLAANASVAPAPEAKTEVFPESGWVTAGSTAPTTAAEFDDGVRMTFRSRPRGGRSHSYRSENSFAWYAFGEDLSTGGGSRRYPDPFSRHSMSHNVILIDGKGQEWVSENNPAEPYVGRLLAYEEGILPGGGTYTHWVGDATKAYRTLSGAGLKRWHRHVLFIDEAYFIVYDDLAMEEGAAPATISWLMKVDAHVGVTLGANEFSWTQGGVNARVVLSQPGSSLDLVNRILRDGYQNVVTGEDMLPECEAAFVNHQVPGGYHDQYPDSMKTYNHIWANTTEPVLRWQNMAALLAWKQGDAAPSVNVLDSRRMQIGIGGDTRTISFNPAEPGDLTIHLNTYREHAGESISLTPLVSAHVGENSALEARGREIEFVISRFENYDSAVSVPFSFSGSATAGLDYYADAIESVTIPADEAVARITVTLLDDALLEGDESIVFTLGGGSYDLGVASVEVAIQDDEEFELDRLTTGLEPGASAAVSLTVGNDSDSAETLTFNYEKTGDGYRWNDSLNSTGEVRVPVFDWQDVRYSGNRVNFVGSSYAATTDGNSIALGFPFPYYGINYPDIEISSSGLIGFESNIGAHVPNHSLPYDHYFSDHRAHLFPLWAYMNRSNSDGVYTQQVDAETFIVQWNEYAGAVGSASRRATFQTVFKKDGTLYFFYKDNNLTESIDDLYTIGIQQQSGPDRDAIPVSQKPYYDETEPTLNPGYLPTGDDINHAIVFWRELALLSMPSDTLVLQPGETQTLQITVDASGLTDGTYLSSLVVDSDISGDGYRYLPVSLTVSPTLPPNAPDGLDAQQTGASHIGLSWQDRSHNETGFRIERSLSPDSGFSTVTTVAANQTSYTDTGATNANSTRYYYRVASINTHGSALSDVVGAGNAPVSPTGVSATAETSTTARIDWSYSGPASAGFRIERSQSGSGIWNQIGFTPADVMSYTDTIAGPERDYDYRVTAFDDFTTGIPSGVAGVSLPSVLIASESGDGEAELSWSPQQGSTAYRVQLRRGAGDWITLAEPTGTDYTLTGLIFGESYEFSVQGMIGGTPGPRSTAMLTLSTPLAESGFLQANTSPHLVLIEAENYSSKATNGSPDAWTETTAFAGYSGSSAMQVLADDSNNYTSNIASTAPALNFDVIFNQTGTHFLLIRCREPGGATNNGSDSLHAGLNGVLSTNAEYIEATSSGSGIGTSWNWASLLVGRTTRVSIEVPSTGKHTINIWPREDGVIVDKILLTTDVNYTATGNEPESTFSSGLPGLNDIESWRQTHFGTTMNVGDAANEAIPAEDGMTNLLKFALGASPSTPASLIRPTFSIVNAQGEDYLAMTYRRKTGGSGSTGVNYAAGGVQYRIELDDDLMPPWSFGTSVVEAWAPPIYNGDDTETVTVRVKTPITNQPKAFLRLRVEPNH